MAGAEATPLLDTGSKGGDPSKDPSSKPAANTKYDTNETSSCCAQRSPWHHRPCPCPPPQMVHRARSLARGVWQRPCVEVVAARPAATPGDPQCHGAPHASSPALGGQQWCRLAFVRCIQPTTSSTIVNYHSIGYKRCYHRLCGVSLLDAVGHNLAHSLTCRPHTQLCARQEQTNNSDIDEML